MKPIFLPTEMIINILNYLNPDDIPKCRLISRQWRDTVDYFMYKNEAFWEENGKQKFPNQFVKSKHNTPKEMTNFQLFKSLALWDSLEEANVVVSFEKFKTPDPFITLQVLEYGKIGIHSKYSILYYNYITKVKTPFLSGIYLKYDENSEYLVVLNKRNQMIINTKQLYDADKTQQTMIPSVSDFILEGKYVYYIEQHDYTVHSLTFCNGKILCKFLFQSPNNIGYWFIEGDEVSLITDCNELLQYKNGTLHNLCKCSISCSHYLQFCFCDITTYLNCHVRANYLRTYSEATSIVFYNRLVFIGTNCGTIYVYREGDPTKRIKTFYVYSGKEIIDIKICEGINSHRLFVLTPNQLYTFMITHL